MKQEYTAPELRVIYFDTEDVITDSLVIDKDTGLPVIKGA